MTWTADKPTVPGYYWHRTDAFPTPQVCEIGVTKSISWIGSDDFDYIEQYHKTPGSQWAGPILPPNEVPT